MNEQQVPEPEVPEEEMEVLHRFLRDNGRMLSVAAGIVLVVSLTVSLYLWRSRTRDERAAAMLYSTRTAQDLEAVVEQYGSTHSAPQAVLRLAKAYFDAGNYDLALSRYTDFEKEFPRHAMLEVAKVGRFHCMEGRGQFQEALALYDAFLQATPAHFLAPQAMFGKARCLEQLGRADEARAVYEDFIVAQPDSPWVFRAQDLLDSMDRRLAALNRGPELGPAGTTLDFGGLTWPAPEGPAALPDEDKAEVEPGADQPNG